MGRSANPVDRYARQVVAGKLPAGKYHRLSCVRHLRDRAREGTPDFPYRFDAKLADRFFRFAAQLRHYKGQWAGQPITLQPHQLFRLGSLFGWVHRDTGLRRFRHWYNELPRKNGKSLEDAVCAVYCTFFDGEPGAEGYCAATKREQARIVFNDCKQLIRTSGLRSRLRVNILNVAHFASASKLEVLGADEDSTDGLNPHFISLDELHAFKQRGMIDVLETATGARRQPVIVKITTAGDDPVSPGGDEHDYACKVLDGVLVDETYFAFIAHADADDDWTLDSTAAKANPNYGVSVNPEDLRAKRTKALGMPAAANSYKQKHLNIWINTAAPWLSVDGWRGGQLHWSDEDRWLVPDFLIGRDCFIGIDMSSKIDLTAVVALFPPLDGEKIWRVVPWVLTPEDTVADRALRDRAPYGRWIEAGYLRTNPGYRIDQSEVIACVAEAAGQFSVRSIGIDPWNAGNIVKELTDVGYDVIEVPQNMGQMSGPSKDFEADVLAGLIDGGSNPLLTWCVSNVVVQRDNKDNVYPVKKKSRGRIDPVVAAIIARKLAQADRDTPLAEDPDLAVA